MTINKQSLNAFILKNRQKGLIIPFKVLKFKNFEKLKFQEFIDKLIFSWPRQNGNISYVRCERETADFESMRSAHAQTFSSLPRE